MSKTPQKEPYYVQIGSEEYPLPMRDSEGKAYPMASGEQVVYVPSWRQPKPVAPGSQDTVSIQHQVFGDVLRQLPTTSMLPLFKQELERRDPNRTDQRSRSFVSGLRGSPAVGKSFMYKLLGKMTHPRGAYVFDCKGVDMGTLFRELVFDISPAVAETNAIDAKILRGNRQGAEHGLKAENLLMLKSVCGEAFHEEELEGKKVISIDWPAVQIRNEAGLPPETHDEQERLAKKFQEVLRQICMSEGIHASENIAKIGLIERDGIAIRACDPNSPDFGRPVMLEDPDQSKAGSMRKLDEWLPVLTGAETSCAVTGAGGRNVLIDRRQFTPSFHVSVTQNQAIAGTGSQHMDSPTMSRLSLLMDTAPDATKHDWVDRICQQLTGVSAYQVYSAVEDLQKDEKLLKDVLLHYRKMGLSKSQVRDLHALDAEQIQNIKNIKKTITLAEHLGEFFDKFALLVNPKSKYHRENNTNLSPEYEEYLMDKAAEINLRAVTNLFNNASTVAVGSKKKAKPDFRKVMESNKQEAHDGQILDAHRISLEDRLGDRGDRLEAYVMELVKKTLVPADAQMRGIDPDEAKQLHAVAVKIATNCHLGVGRVAGAVPELYNLDVSKEPGFRSVHLRDAMVQLLKTQNPTLKLPKDADKLISVAAMERALQALEDAKLHTSQSVTGAVVSNTDPDSFGHMPFKPVMLKDTIPEEGQDEPFHPPAAQLASRDALLVALAIPAAAQKILPSLWNKAISTILEEENEAARIAQNDPSTAFAVTTLMTACEGRAQPVHIIRDKQKDSAIIVGGKLDEKISKMLQGNNITYLDYTAKNAEADIDKAVGAMLQGRSDATAMNGHLKMAFLLRNGKEDECEKNCKRGLGDLMSKPKEIRPSIPIYVTSAENLESLKHLQDEMQKPTAKAKGK